MQIKKYRNFHTDLYWRGNEFRDWIGYWDIFQMHYEPARNIDMVRKIKAVDPNLKVLLYRNVRDIYQSETEEANLARENGWVLKNAAGEEIVDPRFNNNLLIDKGNPAYQEWVANWIKYWVERGGYDGAYLDNALHGTKTILYAAVGYPSGCNAQTVCPPLNPRTGQPFTDADWLQAELQLNLKIKQTLGKPVFANGIWNGQLFWRSDTHNALVTLIQAPSLDGWMSEGFLNDGSGNYYSEEWWKKSVDYIAWIEQKIPKYKSLIITSHWQPTIPSDITHEEQVLYTFASLHLAASSNRLYYMCNEPSAVLTWDKSPFVQNLMKVNLGYPLGNYYVLEDRTVNARVYAREFSRGLVLVNPTANAMSIKLPKTYKNLDGAQVDSVEVGGHRGNVLLEVPVSPIPLLSLIGLFILIPRGR